MSGVRFPPAAPISHIGSPLDGRSVRGPGCRLQRKGHPMSAFKDNLLVGKTAFVAGGTSGINLGIAKRYAELGAKVAVAGRNPEKAQNAAKEIGHGAIGLSCDVRDYGQ